jgi:Domain of unknown function (DUF4399)
MPVRIRLGLLVAVTVASLGVLTSAQTSRSAAKADPKPRVFFVEPKDNATVTSPLHMKFGSEGIKIAAVPTPDPTTSRPGVAHYHVGIDEECLPAGKNIVKGTPSWVHFGDGKDVFDTQLTPGKHRLSLQLGDDLHNTLPNTCMTITVNVKQ